MSEEFDSRARNLCFDAVEFAQSRVSGHKVGACVVAKNPYDEYGYFSGCNIELAASKNYHAESVALVKAISQGFSNILEVHVTSSSKEQQAALCGYCRQDFMYVNPDCMIFVYNPDRTLKIKVRLIETLNYPYLSGNSKISTQKKIGETV